nr:non-ribosomal peptide synthetase [Rubidibacter lacunae]
MRTALPTCTFVNLYGSTEITADATYHRFAAGDPLSKLRIPPIGRPVANTQIYILDGRGCPVPVGVTGELYIGGVQVARGYLNRSDLTAARFVPDPFSTDPDARLYRTGDLGRWRADGTLEYLGRRDFQVKLRGHRIEPGEIEACLRAHAGVDDAVVVARGSESDGGTALAAYVVADMDGADNGGVGLDAQVLRDHVVRHLPSWMVPSAYVLMEAFPLTASGKLDRQALPTPDGEAYVRQTYEAPVGAVEETLARIWSQLLGVEKVSRHDNFFDLGGHSLLAVQTISRLRETLGKEVTVKDLFANPVLRAFAAGLEAAGRSTMPPIAPVDRSARLPLSFAQQRLWFLSELDERAGEAYVISGGARLQGQLDRPALEQALDRIVARHEVLRTRFVSVDGVPEQRIYPADAGFALELTDLREAGDPEAELVRLAGLDSRTGFDLEAGPLIRGRLVQLGEDDHALLVSMHHIVSDGWSLGIFLKELGALYGAFARGESDPLPPLEVQYADYASWQRTWLSGEVLHDQADYWRETLADAPALLELPGDRARPPQQDYRGAARTVVLDEALTRSLKALSERHGVTLHMTLLAAWALLLSRLSGSEDVVVGTPVANRRHRSVEDSIGFFVNTIALRVDLSGSPSVGELLLRVKAGSLAAQDRQDIPFEQVVDLVCSERSLSHAPLFQTMLIWQNAPAASPGLAGLSVTDLEGGEDTSAKFDLTLSLRENSGGIEGSLVYARSLFEGATIGRYLDYWQRLLKGMAVETRPCHDLELMAADERRLVVEEWNASAVAYPEGICLHELFEAQVAKDPSAVALVFEGEELSYGALNERANRLAHHLRILGVGPDGLVGICVERGFEMVVGLLAVLKAGGAYVPLDPAYPVERLRFMLEDSGLQVLLHDGSVAADLIVKLCHACPGTQGVDLAGTEGWREQPATNLERGALTPRNLAYAIYTSGSTGQPKGVMVEHGNIVNQVLWYQEAFAQNGDDVTLQKTPLGFDISVWEIFVPLMCGARLVLARPEGHKDPAYLADIIRETGVTILQFVPSMLEAFLAHRLSADACKSIRHVICAGEALSASLLQGAGRRFPSAGLHNLFGPTETAVVVTSWTCPAGFEGGGVPIGRPVANTQVYILDGRGCPVPVGVTGELYIGGVQVARGYLNRPDLTAARFIANPFSTDPDARLYRTGDLGRWRADGTIEYLGRRDFQLKIRGHRIELGEIEACLSAHAGVGAAVVVARGSGSEGDTSLAAYVVADKDSADRGSVGVNAQALRDHAARHLPLWMVPSAYVLMDAFPLTASGKLDRRALPNPDGAAYVRRIYEAPEGGVEETLARIWSQLLEVERVGRHDNFFDLGGHSLLAVQMIARLPEALGKEVPLAKLFARPTVIAFADVLNSQHCLLDRGITAFRAEGTKPPLFLFQEGSGEVIYGFELTRHIDADIPVYGLTNHGDLSTPLCTIEAIAAHFLDSIKMVQPQGPYYIAGWSFGGLLAYEVATQMIGNDDQVAFLGLFDINCPQSLEPASSEEDYLRRIIKDKHVLLHLAAIAARRGIPIALNDIESPLHQDEVRQYISRMYAYEQAMHQYHIQPIPIPMHLFAAIEGTLVSRSGGWDTVISKEHIHFVSVPGNHWTMMDPPNISCLGASVSKSLKDLDQRVYRQGRSYDPLVTIQTGQMGQIPVFCIPGAGGNVAGFAPLANALDESCPIYGLQPRGLDGQRVPHASVRAASRCYLEAIRTVCPDGPVHLLGHSFGGWIAFQIALELLELRCPAESLTLIDSEAPKQHGDRVSEYTRTEIVTKLIGIYEQAGECSLGIEPAELAQLDAERQIGRLHESLLQHGLMPARSKSQDLQGVVRSFGTALRTKYQPARPYPGRTGLILMSNPKLPESSNAKLFANSVEAWRLWAPELLSWHGPGNHMTALKHPHVRHLSKWIMSNFQGQVGASE